MDKKIIDIHAHIAYWPLFSKTFLDDVVADFRNSGVSSDYVEKLVKIVLSDKYGDKLIRQMDEAGIGKTVLLCTDFDFRKNDTPYSILEMHELHLQQVEKHKDRFIVFAGVSPYREESYEIVSNYIENHGFKGIKLYPPIGFSLSDNRLSRYYELCNYYSLPIMIHTGPSVQGFKQIEKYEEDLKNITQQYKNAKFILAHGAIKDHDKGIKLAQNIENIYLDISSYQGELNRKEVLREKLRECLERVPHKVLFGTDWPMYNFSNQQKNWISELRALDVMDADMEEFLMYKNAESILDLS